MLLVAFICLQALDALSTLIFLNLGVQEANPLIRLVLANCNNYALALAAPKVFAVLLGIYAWRSRRVALLLRMNYIFAVFVVWNFVSILRAPLQ